MKFGKILILNGASSSGKSSILKKLQSILDEPYLDAGIDKFIYMLPSRYLYRPLWDDVLGLSVQAGGIGNKLISGMHNAIIALAKTGNNVIADHVLVETAWVTECIQLFTGYEAYLIGIHCPLEILEEREKNREDRTLGQARVQFPVVHQHKIYDLELDTSKLSVEDCAEQIKSFLQSQPIPYAFPALKNLENSE